MSALARYFRFHGYAVAGYDRVVTPLSAELEAEGISVHYSDNISLIPELFRNEENKAGTLVVYTPAVPSDHSEMVWFKSNGYTLMKRSEVLGVITSGYATYAVAGTHGKTSVSTCLAHMFSSSGQGCQAFLGGISKNYNTNLLLHPDSPYAVVEADEFDRSFLSLTPAAAIITSVDADHLDIYQTREAIGEAFDAFVSKIEKGGKLLVKAGCGFKPKLGIHGYQTYSLEGPADYYASQISVRNGRIVMNVHTPYGDIPGMEVGVPGRLNAENVLAAASLAVWSGIPVGIVKEAAASFKGVVRRYDIQYESDRITYIDDYAHHPREISAFLSSVKEMYPGKKICGVFQPHLYSRTRDFADEFAQSLSLLDELLLLEIYPARELPIPGVNSAMLADKVTISAKSLIGDDEVVSRATATQCDVLVTMGAGNIDRFVEPIREILRNRK
jgi:UDP-N-acetylmuramate--alanine ligase